MIKQCIILLIACLITTVAHANNSNLHPVAQQESNPSRSWFYDGETVVFSSSSSYDLDGYVQARKWYINGTQVSTSTNYSRCFILDGSSGSGCYQLSSGVSTVTIKLEVQDNSGDWGSETIVYEVKDYKKRKYFIKDHLGSIRTTVDIDGSVLGYDDYYPFGLTMPGRSSNSANPNDNYKFTGHERDDEATLDLYHANARGYDPVLGRFMSIDPNSNVYPAYSPYNYAFNNPLMFIDPNGKDGMLTGSGTKDDPYLITANYYYVEGNLNEDELDALNQTASKYNKAGKNGLIKTKDSDGNSVYVKYNMSVIGVESESEARKSAASDTFTDTNGETRSYGNYYSVTESGQVYDPQNTSQIFGTATNFAIELDRSLVQGLTSTTKSNLGKNLMGINIHEVAHNLGADHSDKTKAMEQAGIQHDTSFNTYRIVSLPKIDTNLTRILLMGADKNGYLFTRKK